MRFRDLRVRSRDGSYLVYYDLHERVTERDARDRAAETGFVLHCSERGCGGEGINLVWV